MSIVISSSVVLADVADGLSLDHPVIGWRNIATASTIVADTEEGNYPASNLANPSTNLGWRAGAAGEQYLTITTNEIDPIDYIAVARHNWGSGEIPVSVEGLIDGVWEEIVEEVMLPDDGPALFRFELQSMPMVRIRLQASDASVESALTTTTIREPSTTFLFGSAYTIVDRTSALIPGAVVSSIGIYSALAATLKAKIVKRNSAGNYDVTVSQSFAHPGGGWVDLELSTPYTVPSSGSYYLAALVSSAVTSSVTALGDRAFKLGDITGTGQSGFTEDNTVGGSLPMRYTYQALPRAAVVYAGKLLVVERKVYAGHMAITDGIKVSVANGRSESGNFLGRIVLGESRETVIPLSLISPDWFRTYMRPFLKEGRDLPFFFAWRPQTYPREVGYGWLTDDPMPTPDNTSHLLAFDLKVGGVS
jgi:hypothetical protein